MGDVERKGEHATNRILESEVYPRAYTPYEV